MDQPAGRNPALEVAQNHARRREHEVASRELKLDVRLAELLNSHTLETAIQEVLAVVLAMAVVARLRLAAGRALDVPTLRMSFPKIFLLTQRLRDSFAWTQSDLTPALATTLCLRYFDEVRHRALLPQCSSLFCPRAVRRPPGPEKPPTLLLRHILPLSSPFALTALRLVVAGINKLRLARWAWASRARGLKWKVRSAVPILPA